MTSTQASEASATLEHGVSGPARKLAASDWVILSATILAPAFLTILVPLSHYCVLSLMDEFHTNRGTVMFYLALGVVGQNLLAPFVGRILTQVPPWIVMLAGAVAGSVGLFVASVAPSIIVVAIGFFVTIAIGCTLCGLLGSSAPLASQTIITRQFPSIMGRSVAAQGVMVSVASILMPLVAAPYLTAHGWRATLVAAGLVVLGYTSAVILLFLRNAGPIPASPEGADDSGARHVSEAHSDGPVLTTQQILASPNFWLLLFAIEPIALVVSGISPNIIPVFHDRGVSLDDAKYTLAMLAASSGVGALLAGFVVDRIGPWIYMTSLSAVSVIAMGALSLNLWDPGLPFAALIISVSGLGATLIVAISRLFGRPAFAPVMGLLTPFMMGSAFAGAFTGWMRDQLGTYQVVFGILAAILLISVASSLLLFRAKPTDGTLRHESAVA